MLGTHQRVTQNARLQQEPPIAEYWGHTSSWTAKQLPHQASEGCRTDRWGDIGLSGIATIDDHLCSRISYIIVYDVHVSPLLAVINDHVYAILSYLIVYDIPPLLARYGDYSKTCIRAEYWPTCTVPRIALGFTLVLGVLLTYNVSSTKILLSPHL